MMKKIEIIKNYIKKEKSLIIFFLVGLFIAIFPLPYYVVAPGGITDLEKRVVIDGVDVNKNTFHSTYISEYGGRIPIVLYALFNKDFDIISEKDMLLEGEDYSDELKRGRLDFEESFDNAIISSFKLLNKEVKIKSTKLYILYAEESIRDKFKVGDQILKINNEIIKKHEDISNIIDKLKENDEISVLLKRDSKEIVVKTNLMKIEDNIRIGIGLAFDYDIEVNPNVKPKSKNNEYGPSGGLMTALTIYHSILGEKVPLKIAGTGTIDIEGNVGPIGGVTKKIIAAAKDKVDIFFVPSGENYEEALKFKEERGIKINLVSVKTLEEAVNYIREFDKN